MSVYRVVSCLATQHDYRLVALAALICAAAAFVSLRIYSQALASQRLQKFGLLLLTGICSGGGIWSTHFVAMLAYDPGLPTAYEPIATTASLMIAVVAATAGFAVSSGGGDRWAGLGGAIVGAGIASMHYIGMKALLVPGTLEWDPASVIASLVVGAVLAAAAMIAFQRANSRRALWMSAGLLTLAICGLHFSAMSAVTILPDPTIVVRPSPIGDAVMAIAVASTTLLAMLSGVTAIALIENQTRRQREKELGIHNLRFDTALRHMSQGLCMFDADKRLVVCNERYAKLYQLPPELLKAGTPHGEIIAHRVQNGIYKGDKSNSAVDQKISALDQLPANTSSSRLDELADGRVICVVREPMTGGGWVATHEDVTELHKLNVQLQNSNELLDQRGSRLQAIIDNFPGGITFLDADLRIVVANQTAKTLLDLPDRLFSYGPPLLEDVFRFNAGRNEYGPGDVEEQVATRLALARAGHPHVFERERPNGTVLEVRGVPLKEGGFVTTYVDMTERRRSEAKVIHMAHHDALTNLANRVLLRERLECALATTFRGNHSLAVFMLDLDRFKEINDTLGHPVGDALLKAVAGRLRTCVREGATIARLGGDEFAIVEEVVDAALEATVLAERLQAVLSTPFDLGDHQVVIGSSIGIALAPGDGTGSDQLLRNADLALYRAKGDGSSTYRFFEPGMDARMRERRALEHDLRKALLESQFELYYQPLVDLQSDEVCGFEALLRWHHPERGMVSPAEFIPVAEEIGLIIPVGDWVLRQACEEAATWPDHIRLAVNLSPAQFKSPNLVQTVVNALAASGLPGRRLEVEITESALLQSNPATLAAVHQLRALGIQISMDDFGTGYSSLGYLQNFPFDKIKVDRSFINNLSNGTGAFAILKAITTLARSLDVTTIAEGVETQEQLEKVRALGCREMQGFLFSPPRPARDIRRLFLPSPEVVTAA
jgi:diguanylate cyclase (GGDEF)-like protein